MKYEELGSTRVLINWQPTRLNESTIRREFRALVRKLTGDAGKWLYGYSDGVELRGVGACHAPQGLHRDCHDEAQYLVCWSNCMPTTVVWPNGKRLKAKDGDVILINNLEVLHDSPVNKRGNHINYCDCAKYERWFARVRIRPRA
jgi:hypothetical protein